MEGYIAAFAAALLSGNILMTRFLGADYISVLRRSRKLSGACCVCITVITVLCSLSAYLISGFTNGHVYAAIVFTMLASLFYALVYYAAGKLKGFEDIKQCIPALAADTGIIGVMLLVQDCTSLSSALIFSFGSAAGLCVGLTALAGITQKLRFSNPPKAFSGIPLILAAFAILAMAFSGFSGFSI